MDARAQLPIIAVLGAGQATPDEEVVACRVGEAAARHGWVVLTGGGPGVMAAASKGAVEAGGLTVGILPIENSSRAYPNPWVRIPIYTGAGMARNAFNVLSATLCVAVGGGTGTLSEIAMALKAGVPIWCWRSWDLEPPGDRDVELRTFDDADELLSTLVVELDRIVPTHRVQGDTSGSSGRA
jgi:uncharacterized protein (TIGR00725 family)